MLPADEFTDDIPFAETQSYVKRILGTAENYRHLYGGGLLDPNDSLSAQGLAASNGTPVATMAANRPTSSSATGSTTKKTTTSKKTTAKRSTTAKKR
jgi:hypothetical protein